VASAVAVEQVSRVVQNSDGNHPAEVLCQAVQAASEAIRIQASLKAEHTGMGATCACVWISGDQLYTATVGDSRLYLLRGGKIQQLSTDHTWVQEALEHGVITREQIKRHPNAHVIRRYLGSPVPPDVDLRLRLSDQDDDKRALANQGTRVLPGDMLVLTSDGLTDLVTDEEIYQAFLTQSGEAAGRALIDLANERGGHDNITIVAVQIPDHARVQRTSALPLRRAGLGCAAILLTAVLAASLAGGWWWLSSRAPMTLVATATLTARVDEPALPAQPTLSSTLQVTRAPAAISGFRTPTATRAAILPPDNGPTLTPWPTHTPVK
jgi:protein phosphatase